MNSDQNARGYTYGHTETITNFINEILVIESYVFMLAGFNEKVRFTKVFSWLTSYNCDYKLYKCSQSYLFGKRNSCTKIQSFKWHSLLFWDLQRMNNLKVITKKSF